MAEEELQFVPVPVPHEHLQLVYALLTGLSGKKLSPEQFLQLRASLTGLADEKAWPFASAPASDTGEADGDGEWPYREWTLDRLQGLATHQLASVQTVTQVLDILTEQPGTSVGFTSLAARLKVDRGQLRGSLAAFTRVIHKHYQCRNWPMTWTGTPAAGGESKSELFYTASEDVSTRWKEIRKGQ